MKWTTETSPWKFSSLDASLQAFLPISMRFSLIFALAAHSALAFPWLRPEGMVALLNHPEARAEMVRRLEEHQGAQEGQHVRHQLNTGLLNGVVALLDGTLKAVVDPILGLIPTDDAVKGLRKFPECTPPTIIRIITYSFTCGQQTIPSRLHVRRTSAAHAPV